MKQEIITRVREGSWLQSKRVWSLPELSGFEVRGDVLELTIRRSVIEQHQGDISFESQVARGACCRLRLPLSPLTPMG